MRTKKKELGQFFTDSIIADFMVDLIVTQNTKNILDPAVGLGAFPRSIFKHCKNINIEACEIDQEMIAEFKKDNKYPCALHETDYLITTFKNNFDAIICNPPYNKFQEISNREYLIADFRKRYGISLSGYSNLCVYFLVKSINEMNELGKCCYIIPYEFMNTGYGTIIKKYLLKSGMLKSIYKFENTISLFSEAITTSCILLLEKSNNNVVEFINIDDVKELKSKNFKKRKTYHYSKLKPEDKWLQYFDFSEKKSKYNNTVKLSVFGKVSRGIATGANNFFTLNKSMIKEYGLSNNVCLPCLTKSPDVKDIVFTNESFKRLYFKDKKVYLFDGTKAKSENDFGYIKYGESINADKAYLTSHRSPWYLIEEKKVAPILISVFSREKIKIIRNEVAIKNLTTFHGLHLNNDDVEFHNIMFCYLLTPLAKELLYLSRREYGDGLTKFEPNDLTKADILDLRILDDKDKLTITKIYNQIKKENAEIMIDELDAIFRKYVKMPEVVKIN